MKLKKILTLMCCAVLLVCISVGATVAYLTSTSDAVTNTFTTGNVAITLDEAKVTVNGEKDGDSRVIVNSYKLMPNHTYVKDPTVHITAGSEDSWLFVKVVDEIAAIEAEATVAAQMETNGWAAVAGESNVYAYKEIVSAEEDIVVFEYFKIKNDVENTELAAYAGKTIKVQAYAVQADGFDTAADAWGGAKATWGF